MFLNQRGVTSLTIIIIGLIVIVVVIAVNHFTKGKTDEETITPMNVDVSVDKNAIKMPGSNSKPKSVNNRPPQIPVDNNLGTDGLPNVPVGSGATGLDAPVAPPGDSGGVDAPMAPPVNGGADGLDAPVNPPGGGGDVGIPAAP